MSFFRNATIRGKLSVALGMALALIVVVGLVSILQLQSVNNVTAEIRNVWSPRIETLDEIKRSVAEHRLLATRRMQTTNFRHLATIAKNMDETAKKLRAAEQTLQRTINSRLEQDLFGEFKIEWNQYEESFHAVLQRLEVGELADAQADFNSMALSAFDQAGEKLDQLIAFAKQQSAAAAASADEVYRLAILLTLVVILTAIALSGAAIAWTSRNVTSPIMRVSEAMRRLSAGDHSVAVDDNRERKDEIGVLVGAVSGYRESLVRNSHLAAEAEAERERLHAAVSNMPIGLCMLDKNQQLIICNSRYAEIYDLPPELTETGTPIREIFRHRQRGHFGGQALDGYITDILDSIDRRVPTRHVVEFENGQTLSIINQPMENGGFVGTHEDITERRRAEAQVWHMARYNALTNLPNRVLFQERVGEAFKRVPRGEKIAVLCLDLDRFKSVNDTLGHAAGDALLKLVGQRIRDTLREADSVAHFGGDEFAVVQVGGVQPQEATYLAQRIIEGLSAAYDLDGHEVVIGVTIGIAVAPLDGSDAQQLLKSADIALYRAKGEGRGIYRFFEPEMDARMQARRALELDLRHALANGEFELFYQPLVSVQANEITGFEALLRWHHPQRGTVSPAEFIPLAEEIGLIVPLGEWVLRQACHDAIGWPGDLKVAVNLSPAQFKGKKILETVVMALAVSCLPAARLELEITEGVLLVEHEATVAILHQLRSLGVRIAMDDFGTGYSSLSYLRSFPFDKIKIDGSFIRNISSQESSLAIIRAVTGLSTSLGMATTAEGVETEEQLECVRSEGCTEIQGYLISKPRPAPEVASILITFRTRTAAAA